jgi:hypothetical protein
VTRQEKIGAILAVAALAGVGAALIVGRRTATGLGLGSAPELAPTRESCIECVEKHLGAALVLLTETRDGYPHRLRAIGHLHEAEDESQAFPALHAAIREARKRFQSSGEMPDFVVLEALARV